MIDTRTNARPKRSPGLFHVAFNCCPKLNRKVILQNILAAIREREDVCVEGGGVREKKYTYRHICTNVQIDRYIFLESRLPLCPRRREMKTFVLKFERDR